MAFGGFGSGSGFGSSNNNNQSGGFGGFGSNNTSGFGTSQTTNSAFGNNANTTGGGLFGSGGFGTNNNANASPFGAAKPGGFGTTTNTSGGGSLFGGGNTTSTSGGFGGFGGGNTNTNTSTSAFGGGGTSGGGGLFGSSAQNKPLGGFGSNTGGTGGSLFGSSAPTATTGGGFGSTPSGGGMFGSNTAECQGTGSTPFSAFQEKEANSSTTNHFQSISFMQPYNKFSFEELRLADYAQGRKFGNASGQPGAFGATNFGGFGNTQNNTTGTGFGSSNAGTGGGLFGTSNTSGAGGFGAGTQTSSSFGGGGGGLFGNQNKPAGGLFGAATSSQPSGGLFGTAGTGTGTGTGTGFGQQQPQQQGTGFGNTGGGGLFGQGNQQKSGFSFGSQNAATTSSGGFGGFGNTTSNSTGGLFGQNNQSQPQTQGPGLFGNNNQQPASSNLFGQQNQTQNQPQSTGFGGFGQNQQKPGLFGGTSTNTGGGLFGGGQNNQQQNAGSNLFGGANNTNNAGGGLFGSKPAAPTNNLFGGGNPNAGNTNAGGGLFGGMNNNNQGQQNAGGGLFGGGQQQQNKPSLFGTSGTGSNLFGNSQQNNNQGGGGFGQSNQNQSSLFGGSTLLGSSQQNSLQAPQGFTASINDPTPYGSASIFNGLPPPPQDNPGPIATPIASGQKQRKPAALPQYKINPAMASRLVTPRKQQGYGFTYSTYGTPSSVSSVSSTPGNMGASLGSSLTRALGKSLSTSNLRRTFDTEGDSILAPGAFSASSGRYSGGSMKKLVIDRSLRTDLFGSQAVAALPSPDRNESPRTQSILKKKVSFDANTAGGENGASNGVTDGGPTPSAEEQNYLRPSRHSRTNGVRSSHNQAQPEMSQITSTELTIVHEDGSPDMARTGTGLRKGLYDPIPGKYWSNPTIEELKKMPTSQLKNLPDVTIGRDACGWCHFDEPIDLSNINLDEIFDIIAVVELRSVTIYPSGVKKPPVGMGMNVPSTLCLFNSWPRSRDRITPLKETSGPKYDKHVHRLKKTPDTDFVSYKGESGEWTFRVPHFTTYALDYDDDDEDMSQADDFQSSMLSEAPPTPTPKSKGPKVRSSPLTERLNEQDTSMMMDDATHTSSEPEDTFAFKTGRSFPGAFDDVPVFDDDQEMEEVNQNGESFLEERSVSSTSEGDDEPSEMDDTTPVENTLILGEDVNLVGSFPTEEPEDPAPKSILKASRQPTSFGTPGKPFFAAQDDWTEQLQHTISPKKQDREALRQSQARLFKEIDDHDEETPTKPTPNRDGEIATSIDLMNSLFGKEHARRSKIGPKQGGGQKGFKWPYPRSKIPDQSELTHEDRLFHNSFKPAWGPGSLLLYAADEPADTSSQEADMELTHITHIEHRDIRSSKFHASHDLTEGNFRKQRDQAEIRLEDGVPFAHAAPWSFVTGTKYSSAVEAHDHEPLVWELASILFDEHHDEMPHDLPDHIKAQFQQRITKDRLSAFWARLCREEATLAVAAASNAEERAIAFLSMNKVAEACNALVEGKDYRLATLIAQIGGDRTMHDDITAQIDEWRKLNVLSEMSDSIRTLYELLAGNTCTSVGKKGPIEDRASTFVISERFGMSWKRAFGLKLWYSTLSNEPLETAVQDFLADLADKEVKKPTPWFLADQRTSPLWDDPHADQREDVLWGLLKLYSDQSAQAGTLSAVVSPENISDNPLSTRLPFELYHTLASHFPHHTSTLGGDQVTLAFASELESAGDWLWALHALLRLSDPQQRQHSLQKTLSIYAGQINEHNPDQLALLFKDFKIPSRWVWESKALYARAVAKDHVAETRYLLQAKNWDEAHTTLCAVVAPQAIVERSYHPLQTLLDSFDTKPDNWRTGGGVYADYLRLVQDRASTEEGALLGRLVRVLGEMHDNIGSKKSGSGNSSSGGHGNFLKRVAVQDMSAVVGDRVLAGAGGDAKEQAWVLQLPLTEETKRVRAAELSLGYYRKIMAMGG